MIRLTEIRLPLEHPPGALRAAVVARLGVADAACRDDDRLQARLRRAQARRDRLRLHDRLRGPTTRPRCSPGTPAIRMSGRRPTCATGSSPRRPPTSPPARRPGRSSSASARAACSPRWCWRRWAFARSSSSAAARCASARRTRGACGGAACSTLNRTSSSAKAAPAPSPTASSGARSATRGTSRAR